jgi:hypothetical protein
MEAYRKFYEGRRRDPRFCIEGSTTFTVFHRVPSPTRRLRHPWRTLFLTLPLAEAGGGLPLDTRGDPEPLELLPAESLGQEVGRHVVCRAPDEGDDFGLEEFASVLVGDVNVFGALRVGAVLG